jgi:hypothetical protein
VAIELLIAAFFVLWPVANDRKTSRFPVVSTIFWDFVSQDDSIACKSGELIGHSTQVFSSASHCSRWDCFAAGTIKQVKGDLINLPKTAVGVLSSCNVVMQYLCEIVRIVRDRNSPK